MNTTKVFVACALGALIGSIVALQMNPYLWWIGLLVGGLTGYLSYEFKAVIAAVPKAWNAASWRPSKEVKWATVAFICVYISIVSIVLGIAILNPIPKREVLIAKPDILLYSFLGLMTSLVFLIGLTITLIEQPKLKNNITKSFQLIALYCNPISVATFLPLWCLYKFITHLPAMIAFIFKTGWSIICTLGRFIKFLFLLIHSDIRLLCGIDATIGSGIGYLTGNVLIGMVAGGVFGVLNYQIVSLKILKVVPVKNIS
ncbi:MAG: hypothetical protein COV55_02260 [Candidatus Komeilibacteria bacterium CG11_big_fil_rev_8_21_14_0_20_36_20]|uniref:Uncharacterized protein n=1 Tax=Candidatus Komeilibacteria bacterium CG11_big_fil_rev_8_21_14_0_20_36_20 TaxID=1974477 RepID=A0A2H0NCZ3_9BACT|nr:MAG: hypothetical protein COV55_02260 [Candidatus Komeilibacteria bacterium CG11_big_fil_rev_8_21_14_0_20_36_20]PIR81798.1 MAG: hypothetical protein COU21_01320 [Candidatus Komeilibacteria bacterium CG10_big_fil_rev_8_21_14_0_10_36_65]PJC55288.1 MAG: hypothetical protein CO027_02655 [Candidatus Komeilibacteria bacterium CG_4_9_14_0_2_um_filter_36_13]